MVVATSFLAITGRRTALGIFQRRAFASKDSDFYTVGITGASGLVGSSLIDELIKQDTLYGKPIRIVKLTRTTENIENDTTIEDDARMTSLPWNPTASEATAIAPKVMKDIDALVHLAGENAATGRGPLGFLGLRPWTADKKAGIMDSRVGPTAALAKAVAASETPTSFLAASGVGVYGNDFIGNDDDVAAVDETMDISATNGFLAEVSRKWEAAAAAVTTNRVVNCRMGVVLSKKGGAMGKLYPVFLFGGGGIVGCGRQYFSFVSARDAARALVHILHQPSLSGPVNVCAPKPCTNTEFTTAFGKVLSRPTILPLPAFAVKLLFGDMGDEMLLGGVRTVPSKLTDSGFQFHHPDIETACRSAVEETI